MSVMPDHIPIPMPGGFDIELPRFVKMLRSPPYDRLLNHREVDYGPLRVEDDTAYQPVIVTASDGQQAGYLWVMSRQRDGEYKDCWMTDAVLSTEPPARLRFALAAPVGNATTPLIQGAFTAKVNPRQSGKSINEHGSNPLAG